MKKYIENARDDFKRDSVEADTPLEREAYDICRQRLDAILTRVKQEEEDGKATHGQTVLEVAHDIIHGERLKHYGHPKVNFERIAVSWEQLLNHPVTPVQVCVMMILLKSQRMAEGYHRDTVVDIGGYAALAAILAGDDEL